MKAKDTAKLMTFDEWDLTQDERDAIAALLEENARISDENAQLRAVNEQTYCAYCNKTYVRSESNMDDIRKHIGECEKHPMRELERDIARLKDAMDFYQACGFVIYEVREENGRLSKFVGHAGAEHYPPRPVE